MHIILRCYQLLNVLTNPQPHPVLFPTEATAWDQQDLQAFSLVALSLTGELAHLIFHVQTEKECLKCLLAHFKGRGGHKISQLMNQLFSTPLNDTKPLEPQINVMINASHHLAEVGSPFTSQQVTYAITNALPMSHRMLKVILNNLSTAEQTPENLKVHILTNKDFHICESGDGAAAFYPKPLRRARTAKRSQRRRRTKTRKRGTKASMQISRENAAPTANTSATTLPNAENSRHRKTRRQKM